MKTQTLSLIGELHKLDGFRYNWKFKNERGLVKLNKSAMYAEIIVYIYTRIYCLLFNISREIKN